MNFNGTWKVNQNENYTKFLEEMGVTLVMRKLAEHDKQTLTFQQDGDNFHVKECSLLRTKEISFCLGVPFQYQLADGTEIEGTWVCEGNKLKGNFTRKDNGKTLLINREVAEDQLVQSYSYNGVNAKRIYKRA